MCLALLGASLSEISLNVVVITHLCNGNQQNALLKLMFENSSSCLLHVSNILCSLSGRIYCTCSLYGMFSMQ
jgi:hypothetical protein